MIIMYCGNQKELPKYVQRDLEILYNFEFSRDKYGYEINKTDKIAYKLYQIAKKYPQKWLEPIIEYLGYLDCGDVELAEKDYRDEIFHMAEYYFKQAMQDPFLMYSNLDEQSEDDYTCDMRQCKFIDIGWLDAIYTRKSYLKKYKDITRYPSKAVEI